MPDVAHVILADYVDSLTTDLVALGSALTGAREEGVRRAAHCIKGAARTVGHTKWPSWQPAWRPLASTSVDDWDLLRSTARDLDVASGRVAHAWAADLETSQ